MMDISWMKESTKRFYRKEISPFRIIAFRLLIVIIIILIIALIFWYFEKDHIKDDAGDDFTYIDSLYFTVVTITTLGYGDIVPVSEEARMFDTLIITPIRMIVWLLFIGTAYQIVIRNYWERYTMERKLRDLKDHVIICGYGTTGAAAVEELLAKGYNEDKLIVIDTNEESVKESAEAGATGFLGDPTREEILLKAGIKGAKRLIIATNQDDTNVLITLTAKDLNRQIKIISRVSQEENIKQLKRAGADVIISPSLTSGHLMAMAVSTSQSVELIEELLTSSRGANVLQRKVKESEINSKVNDFKKSVVIGVIRNGKKIGPTELDNVVLKNGDEIIIIA
jgi:voltage-gated potassium channel